MSLGLVESLFEEEEFKSGVDKLKHYSRMIIGGRKITGGDGKFLRTLVRCGDAAFKCIR